MKAGSGAPKYMRLLFHLQCTYNAVPLVKSGPPLLPNSSRLTPAGSPGSSVESSAAGSSELLGESSSQSSPGGSTTGSGCLIIDDCGNHPGSLIFAFRSRSATIRT